MFKSICVFCGSSLGNSPSFVQAAAEFGRLLARRGLNLVYGGGDVGTMGAPARSAMEAGAHVTGIIPKRLNALVEHLGLSELVVVEDMHERKALMQERSDAFAALPGGIGTMEELFEVWTWRYIGYHAKPVGILNVGGFYDGLLGFLESISESGFVDPRILADLCVEASPEALLDSLEKKTMEDPRRLSKAPERSGG